MAIRCSTAEGGGGAVSKSVGAARRRALFRQSGRCRRASGPPPPAATATGPSCCRHAVRCRCCLLLSPAFVEPPVAMMSTMAFSNAARVMMSRGFRSFFSSSST